ncbi:protein G12-like [Ochlerotatus camptorhynchus]|uniref:protein G12-like n=1 Tax=Ochlerotatus camptorhynchus TaxID=644619 RepID=UPI0031D3C3C1
MKGLLFLFSLGLYLKITFGDDSQVRGDLIGIQQSLPIDRLRILLAEYLVHDPQFRRTIQYMGSVEFSEAWNKFMEIEKVKELLRYIDDAGLPVNRVLNMLSDFTGTRSRVKRFIQLRKGGLSAFVDDAIKIVSSSDMMGVHEKNKNNNPQYKGITDKLTAPEFGRLIREVLDDPEVQAIQEQVKPHGIDIEKLLDLFKAFFGWNELF